MREGVITVHFMIEPRKWDDCVTSRKRVPLQDMSWRLDMTGQSILSTPREQTPEQPGAGRQRFRISLVSPFPPVIMAKYSQVVFPPNTITWIRMWYSSQGQAFVEPLFIYRAC